jgi:hypothetical protein
VLPQLVTSYAYYTFVYILSPGHYVGCRVPWIMSVNLVGRVNVELGTFRDSKMFAFILFSCCRL